MSSRTDPPSKSRNHGIPKGFILKARQIEDSEIAHASPCTREVFDLIVRKANFQNRRCGDTTIQRGQWLTTYDEIRELLSWRVGFYKMVYTRGQIEAGMKWLRSRLMVTTAKTTRGLFITVTNYELYQRIGNYEHHTESPDEDRNDTLRQRRNEKECRSIVISPNQPDTRVGQQGSTVTQPRKAARMVEYTPDFDRFWRVYPRKVSKLAAFEAWMALNPGPELTEKIVASVQAYAQTEQWTRSLAEDGGKFIPHPATFLNQRRYDDTPPAKPEPKPGDDDWYPTEEEVDEAMGRGKEARQRQGARTDIQEKFPEGSKGQARDKAGEIVRRQAPILRDRFFRAPGFASYSGDLVSLQLYLLDGCSTVQIACVRGYEC